MKNFILVGTDTNVGKTLTSAWILAHLPYTYWKPVASGVESDDDNLSVSRLSGVAEDRIFPSAYRLKAPLSPHWAAEQEGIKIDTSRLTTPKINPLLIEGAGGILTPLTHQTLFLDWIKTTQLPVIIVARDHIGTINHACLTLRALRQEGVPVLGVILSAGESCVPDPRHGDAIVHFGEASLLAHIPYIKDLSPESLRRLPLPLTLLEALT
jgi:dethiobiotin synthetase